MNNLDAFRPECSLEELGRPEHVSDDFEAAGINSKEDVRAVFSGNFYFGCEADDRATMWAFDPRMGVRLRPVFSSDFTHFDVPDFKDVIPEAFEMVEKGFVTEAGFPGVHVRQRRASAHAQQPRTSSRAPSSSKRWPMSLD